MRSLMIFLILLFVLVTTQGIYAQCTTDVTLVAAGPPSWEYQFSGTGTGSKWSFIISGGCGVTDATATLPDWTAIPAADGATFYTLVGDACTLVLTGFVVTAAGPGVANGTVFWQDPIGGSSGTVDGPICVSVPTDTPTASPTGTFFTPTPTPTPTGPTHTPTVGIGSLQLVAAGPPLWTYRFYGTTLGFHLDVDLSCVITDSRPPDWSCISLGGGYDCANITSPDPTPQWHEFFVFSEINPPGAFDGDITYNTLPSGPSNPIRGPICVPTETPIFSYTPTETSTLTPTTPGVTHTPTMMATDTPTMVMTDTPTPTTSTSHTIPIGSGSGQILMFMLLSVVAVILIFKAIKG
jgi:hypothetical protein